MHRQNTTIKLIEIAKPKVNCKVCTRKSSPKKKFYRRSIIYVANSSKYRQSQMKNDDKISKNLVSTLREISIQIFYLFLHKHQYIANSDQFTKRHYCIQLFFLFFFGSKFLLKVVNIYTNAAS